jgi:hypothetical protein
MKKVFKVFTFLFIGASAVFFWTACNKENILQTGSANQTDALKMVSGSENQIDQKVNPIDIPPPIDDNHRENDSKYVLSNLPSTGATQIHHTCLLYIDLSGWPDPPPAECAEMPRVYSKCNSITVTGIPGTTSPLLLKNSIGLAVGGQNVVYITTGNNSGLASNSLFRVDINTGTGWFIAKTKTATGVPMPVQDIECKSVNSGAAFGLVNNQLAILNLATGIYTLKTLPTGVYSGLTVLNNTTIAVFMPNHVAGTTFGGYRTVNTTTWAASNIVNWNSTSASLVQGDGGLANSSNGLRVSSIQAGGVSTTSCNIPYFINLGNSSIMYDNSLVPAFDYTNY